VTPQAAWRSGQRRSAYQRSYPTSTSSPVTAVSTGMGDRLRNRWVLSWRLNAASDIVSNIRHRDGAVSTWRILIIMYRVTACAII